MQTQAIACSFPPHYRHQPVLPHKRSKGDEAPLCEEEEEEEEMYHSLNMKVLL